MFKKTLLALAATAALASAVPAQAASFYLTIPLNSRGTAPIGDVSVNLANGTLANAMVGEPYSATVKNHLAVTGDEAFNFNRVGWGVSTGSIPAGLNFNVTTGAITGTPTAPGANTFGITATYRGKADEGMFNLSVMEILLALQNNTLPAGVIGSPYNAGLQNFLTVTGDQAFNGSNVGWSFTSGSLPAGLVLNAATGEISGTPTGPSSAPFVVSATYRGKTAAGTYSLSVLDITMNLAAATLPKAFVGETYSANLAADLTVANDASYVPGTTPVNWVISSGTLPAGLTLSAAGLVAGTPEVASPEGASFTVEAQYRGARGQAVYSIKIGGVLVKATQVVSGGIFSCLLTPAGGVKCWGSNQWGQIGDGTIGGERGIPTDVVGLASGVESIAAGAYHICAVLTNGTAKCWGYGLSGQLGQSQTQNSSVPITAMVLGNNVKSIQPSYFHTCAVMKDSSVVCFGSGFGSPAIVPGLESGVVSMSSAGWHNCAIMTNGTVKCWGDNTFGQVGVGTVTPWETTAQVVPGLTGVKAIGTGAYHSCAVLTGGSVKCWGRNTEGEIGDKTFTSKSTPTQVSGLTAGATSVSLGYYFSCALVSGAVTCWGANDTGQHGTGDRSTTTSPNTATAEMGVMTVLGAGGYHVCGIGADTGVKCWGQNGYKQVSSKAISDQTVGTHISY